MDQTTHIILLSAGILVIISCLMWIATYVYFYRRADAIKGDINKLVQDVDNLSKLAKNFLQGQTEGYIPYNSKGYPPEGDDRYWRKDSQYHYPYFE